MSTSALLHAAGAEPHSTVGSVLSMLIPLTAPVVLFPARSTAVPLTDCSAPSDATVTGVGPHEAMPDGASSHVNETTTSALFQPDAFAAGNREPPIVGAGPGAMADPLPQALVLTAIVIGFGMTAYLVALMLRSKSESGTDHVDTEERE